MSDFYTTTHQGGIAIPPPSPSVGADPSSSSLSEVTVRTMASDLESMGMTGGGGMRPEVIRVSHDTKRAVIDTPIEKAESRKALPLTLLALAAIGILFLIGYFVVPRIFS